MRLLRRFVDWDLSRTSGVRAGAWSLFLTFLPALALIEGARLLDVEPNRAAIALTIVVTAAWAAFVAWRWWRLLKAYAIKGDREYDRRGKLRLPPEYRESESVTRARRKQRRP